MKRLMLCALLVGLLATNSGCGLFQAVFCYRPCITQGDCPPGFGMDGCDEGCGPICGPTRRPVRPTGCAPRRSWVAADCGAGCDMECGRPCRGPYCRRCAPCDDPCMDPCGDACYGRCWHRGPLSCLFALLMRGSWWGPNCGEAYWGDFYSDPPDCWDPCDGYGNYTGHGCDSCGGYGNAYGGFDGYTGGPVDDGMGVARENIISRTDRAVGPVAQPHRAVRR